MNILYICADMGIPVLGRKGASVHVRSLVSAFTNDGHAVVVAAPVLSKSPWEEPAVLNGRALHVPADDTTIAAVDAIKGYSEMLSVPPSLASEVRRMLYTRQLEATLTRRFEHACPDFVYERASLYSTVGAGVARALRVPLVVELNAPLALEQSTYRGSQIHGVAEAAERHTLSAASLVLTVSSPLREYLVNAGADPARVVTIPNAIDPRMFAPGRASEAMRRRLGVHGGPVIGFVGGLRPWHGVRALPDLLTRVVRVHPTTQLVIAGDGPARGDLVAAFQAREVNDRVVFTGPLAHDEIPDVIRLFDVAVAPYETTDHPFYFSPLKLFEYMGCGVATVAASIGQIAEIVRHGHNGLLYQPGNQEDFIAACMRLLDNATLRGELGRAAAAEVHERFTWTHNARRIVAAVDTLKRKAEVAA